MYLPSQACLAGGFVSGSWTLRISSWSGLVAQASHLSYWGKEGQEFNHQWTTEWVQSTLDNLVRPCLKTKQDKIKPSKPKTSKTECWEYSSMVEHLHKCACSRRFNPTSQKQEPRENIVRVGIVAHLEECLRRMNEVTGYGRAQLQFSTQGKQGWGSSWLHEAISEKTT